jgi:hypothetical protein
MLIRFWVNGHLPHPAFNQDDSVKNEFGFFKRKICGGYIWWRLFYDSERVSRATVMSQFKSKHVNFKGL